MELIYWGSSLEGEESLKELHSCVILTGNEAVSRSVLTSSICPSSRESLLGPSHSPLWSAVLLLCRSVMSTIQSSAAKCPSFRSVIPKNRDDESRIQAIRKELTELGSEVCGTMS